MKNTLKAFSAIALSLLISSFLFFSCSTNSSTKEEKNSNAVKVNQTTQRPYDISDNETANMKLVEDYIEASMNLDETKIRSVLSADYMEYGPSASDSFNLEETIAFFKQFDKLYTNQKSGIAYMTALRVNEGNLKGEWVQVWGEYTAIDRQSQQKITVPWHSAVTIENNKITGRLKYWDNLTPSLQLGQVVPPTK